MVGSLLLRGMLVGIFAGILAFGFGRIFGEPQVDAAIAFEEQMAKAESNGGQAEEVEIVSRPTQAGIGLFVGVVTYGAAVGGLFALAFAYAYGRVGQLSARSTAALLALGGFIAVVIVPDIKYPANPPSVGNSETIGFRTELFFIMLVLSIAALWVAVRLAWQLQARFGTWNGAIMAGVAYVAAIAVFQYALPTINEVPEQFSAVVLWKFRTASLGMHAILWATLGLAFGAVAERAVGEPARRLRIASAH